MQIVASVRLRKSIQDEWLRILGGGVSKVFGFLLKALPGVDRLQRFAATPRAHAHVADAPSTDAARTPRALSAALGTSMSTGLPTQASSASPASRASTMCMSG